VPKILQTGTGGLRCGNQITGKRHFGTLHIYFIVAQNIITLV